MTWIRSAVARGGGGIPVLKPGDARPYFYPKRLICPEAAHCAEGWGYREPDRGFARVENALNGGYRFTTPGQANIEYDASLNDFAIPHGSFVGIGVHEHLHHLGFFSDIPTGNARIYQRERVWGAAGPQRFTGSQQAGPVCPAPRGHAARHR